LPIVLYNVPGRTVASINVETMERLAQLPRIVGVKDATGDLTRVHKTRATCGDDFVQLSGEDSQALPYLTLGGHGIISVTSNIAPGLCSSLQNAYAAGDLEQAQAINDKLLPLHDAMFFETSPGPAKFAASLLGLCRNEFRLPLVPVAKPTEAVVHAAMLQAGLLDNVATIKRAV
ncbi:MAG: dihydrodipicolinate synthase family protein, partial [Alphaproteobacteria bacterium]|nr:dihydrodipicolinate synthase family protein [Alphaproteobacteria bacterium]